MDLADARACGCTSQNGFQHPNLIYNTLHQFVGIRCFGKRLKWLSELEQERLRSSWLSWLSTQKLSWRPLMASSHGRPRELKTIHCVLQKRLGATSEPSIVCAHSQRSRPTHFAAEALPRAASSYCIASLNSSAIHAEDFTELRCGLELPTSRTR